MMPFRLCLPAVLVLLALLAGCSHLDVGDSGDPNRVLTGTLVAGVPLPAGAEVTVRVVSVAADPARPPGGDVPIATSHPSAPPMERVLGETVQKVPVGAGAVTFRVEYQADDATLRRGLTVDARVSVDGVLCYRTVNAHVITLNSSRQPQEISVQPVAR